MADMDKIIVGAMTLIIGLILIPLVAHFIWITKMNNSTLENEYISGISGLGTILDLVAYGFTFGLVGVGIGMIVWGAKGN